MDEYMENVSVFPAGGVLNIPNIKFRAWDKKQGIEIQYAFRGMLHNGSYMVWENFGEEAIYVDDYFEDDNDRYEITMSWFDGHKWHDVEFKNGGNANGQG